jgi:hypothetical protein
MQAVPELLQVLVSSAAVLACLADTLTGMVLLLTAQPTETAAAHNPDQASREMPQVCFHNVCPRCVSQNLGVRRVWGAVQGGRATCLQHALAFIQEMYQTSRKILDRDAIAGMSSIAARGAAQLSEAVESTAGNLQMAKVALEMLMSLVRMAAAGSAASALLHCPRLAAALQKADISQDPTAKNGASSTCELPSLRWVVAVEVWISRLPVCDIVALTV